MNSYVSPDLTGLGNIKGFIQQNIETLELINSISTTPESKISSKIPDNKLTKHKSRKSKAQDTIDNDNLKKVAKTALKSIVKGMSAFSRTPETTEYYYLQKTNISP